ncbi:cytochrome c oxidase subunit II [Diaphorobacter aerolatus]|uniref:C-type cytochrome n=1 Tax=Diaphorobacter aerolatus TaxID=1288495 RepID=A0A7H0GKY3_9BURK|nr:c-type cytochrome [Diaphorobacter aerolatus]QNP48949.1 c-type cytochrome [Diaphorobacter aerolatus]
MTSPHTGTPQSALHAGGEQSASFIELTTALVVGGSVIFLGVMLLLALSFKRQRKPNARLWLLGGGIAMPMVVLTVLFFYSEWLRPAWRPIPPADALVVTVTGRMWWWDVSYHDPTSGLRFATANEIRLPVGRPVYFALASEDVIHSFWVPALGGKMDMVPGRLQHLLLTPRTTGRWRGQCAEFCGAQHALMALDVVVSPHHEFDAWAQAQARPIARSDALLSHPGRAAFLENRCNFCHTVRGVSDALEPGGRARLGPDLTHVGSRLSLAAATLANTPDNMAHWIGHTQDIKPEARMPSGAGRVPPQDLEDIAAWLSLLK